MIYFTGQSLHNTPVNKDSKLVLQCSQFNYLPQITLPPCVTRPSSLTFTSMTVPLVITPNDVYKGEDGFFFTPRIGRQKVALSSGCVTCAFLKRKPCCTKSWNNLFFKLSQLIQHIMSSALCILTDWEERNNPEYRMSSAQYKMPGLLRT